MVHFNLIKFHMYIWRGYPLPVAAVDLLCRFLLSVFYIAGFYSRNQLPCFAAKTKKGNLHMNRTRYPDNESGTPTCLKFFCLGAPICRPWRHDKTKKDDINGDKVTNLLIELWKNNSCALLAQAFSSYPTTSNDHFCVQCKLSTKTC